MVKVISRHVQERHHTTKIAIEQFSNSLHRKPGQLVKPQIAQLSPRASDSAGLGQSQTIRSSNKFPGAAGVANLGTAL